MKQKDKILTRAAELFLTRGIKNVSMDSLAMDLSISKRTIYETFKDKESLVIECIRYLILHDNEEALEIIAHSENVIQALFLILQHQHEKREKHPIVFMEDIKKYFPLVQATFYSCKNDLKRFSASYVLLEKGIKQGIFRKGLRIELVDNFLHELVSMIHQSDRLRSIEATEIDVLNNIFIPYFRGISTPKGVILIDQFFESINE